MTLLQAALVQLGPGGDFVREYATAPEQPSRLTARRPAPFTSFGTGPWLSRESPESSRGDQPPDSNIDPFSCLARLVGVLTACAQRLERQRTGLANALGPALSSLRSPMRVLEHAADSRSGIGNRALIDSRLRFAQTFEMSQLERTTAPMNLTPKQLRILQLIRDWRVRKGYSPTMQELADEIGVSKVTVFEHVEALIKKQALVREPNKARSLSIAEGIAVPDEARPLRFPLVGKIAAGNPIERVANEDEIDLGEVLSPPSSKGQNSTFALKVEGDSMRDEGILDGDFVLIERTQVAANGDKVVALLPDGSTTLKTFFKEDDHIRLQPANPQFDPIRVKFCQVQGIVKGVVRRYGR